MQELNFPFSHGHHICSTHHKSWDHRSELRSPRGRCSLIVPASFPGMKQFVSESHTWSWCLQTCFPWLVSEMPGFLLRCGGQNWARGCQRSPPCVCAEAGKIFDWITIGKLFDCNLCLCVGDSFLKQDNRCLVFSDTDQECYKKLPTSDTSDSSCLTFSSQALNSRTSDNAPALVKSPAWTKTSPSGTGFFMCEVREWVSDMQTNLSC